MRKKLERNDKRTKYRLYHKTKTPLLGILSLLAILSGLLLFYTGWSNQKNIIISFCHSGGFFGHEIILYDNGSYEETIYGCLGSDIFDGEWIASDSLLVLFPNDAELDATEQYIISNDIILSPETIARRYNQCNDSQDLWKEENELKDLLSRSR